MAKRFSSFTQFASRSALVAATAMLAFTSVPVEAKDNARMEAVKLCAAKVNDQYGAGKLVKARVRRQRKGYAVTMVKLSPEGKELADVSCTVSRGELTEYAANGQVILADARD